MTKKEEVDKRFILVRQDVNNGMNVDAACKKHGLGKGSYYDRIKLPKKITSKKHIGRVVEIKDAPRPNGKVILLIGSPEEVIDAARRML